MAPKILTILATIFVVAAAILSYLNKGFLDEETSALASQQNLLKEKQADLQEVKEQIVAVKEEVEELTVEVATTTEDLAKATAEAEALKSTQAALEGEKTEAETNLGKLEKDIEDIGSIGEVDQEMQAVSSEIELLKSEIADAKRNLEFTQRRQASVSQTLDETRATISMKKRGFVDGGLSTTVRSVDPEWGYLILNAGDRRGVVPKAEFEIRRGTSLIARAVVTSIEPNISAATVTESFGIISVGDVAVHEAPALPEVSEEAPSPLPTVVTPPVEEIMEEEPAAEEAPADPFADDLFDF
ncbi:MAG: hypothetical protein AAF555_09640 [Verrucomicrobiota bacterium]